MPRILDVKRCPHCGADLPQPAPRSCPTCAGSLQQRYLRTGCLSTAPVWLVAGWLVVGWLAARLG